MRGWVPAFAMTALLALGLFPHEWGFLFEMDGSGLGDGNPVLAALWVAGMVSPAIPLVAILFGWSRGAKKFSRVLVVSGAVLGPVLAIGAAIFLPSGSTGIRFHAGIAVVVSVIGTGLLLPGPSRGMWARRLGWAGLAYGALVGLWSLVNVPLVVVAANRVAGDKPFCVDFHESGKAVDSFWDLRGAFFLATATGYKSTSKWYFHAVQKVHGDIGLEFYNWSHRNQSFERLENWPAMAVSVANVCVPRPNFWTSL